MIFLNKSTDVKWEISDEEHIRRLLNDKNYEVIEDLTQKLDLNTLSYVELQSIAKSKGIKHTGIKKQDLIKLLEDGE